MTHIVYLTGLLLGIAGLVILDYRFKLAFWTDTVRTIKTILIGVTFFIVWDLLGIRFDIFLQGHSQYMLPFSILPEFPLEELFFLFLLCYLTLLLYLGGNKWRLRI